jgi:hypothetical protein
VKATDIRDCQRFAKAVCAAGGTVPDALGHLLSSYELLSAPVATARADEAIMDAALAGTLTAEVLARLAPKAAAAEAVNNYLRSLAQNCAHTLVGQFHRELENGAADAILTSLRPSFDKHAKAIGEARELIDPRASADQILAAGQPGTIAVWQGLDAHIRAVTAIAAVASQFGCRPAATFPMLAEYPQGSTYQVDDRGLMCADGDLVRDSAAFGRPDAGHRSSPFFCVDLRLHSIASAKERYSAWAADEFDRINSGPRGGWVDESGHVHEHPRPTNPYRQAS